MDLVSRYTVEVSLVSNTPTITTTLTAGDVSTVAATLVNNVGLLSVVVGQVSSDVELGGARYFVGPRGDKGDTGSIGAQGLKGDKGDKGDTGDQGLQGIQGLKGGQGLQGEQGLQGLQGLQGIQGIKGNTGDKGDPGEGVTEQELVDVVTAISKDIKALGSKDAVMTYELGILVRVDYPNGEYKALSYSDENLVQVDHINGTITTRKTLNYSGSTLVSVVETVV